MMLFIVGVIEMVIISSWTKAVTETKVLVSGVITVINVLIWYYVLQTVVDNMENWYLILSYAVGCAVGTMLTTYYFGWKDTKAAKKLTTLPA